jgi:peptidoglycan glycosyltransferase
MESTIPPDQARMLTLLVRIGFFCGVAWVAWLLVFKGAGAQKGVKAVKNPKLQRIQLVSWVLIAAFAGILCYQATWQLAGFFRPRFVAFMQKHDRRKFNPALQMQRGAILDRNGTALAKNKSAKEITQRHYPMGAATSHIVGYFDPVFGVTGLESIADPFLSGLQDISSEGWESIGQQLLTRKDLPKGKDLRLTLDARLQNAVHSKLTQGRYAKDAKPAPGKPHRGAVVVLDIRDGSLLAACSAPAYNPNQLNRHIFADKQAGAPLFNRALHGLYPPGSVFKVAVGSYYLEKILLGAGYPLSIKCGPEYRTPDGKGVIRDLNYYSYQDRGKTWPGFGTIELEQAVEQSCNVYFAQIGVTIGKDGFEWMRKLIGFDQAIPLYIGPLEELRSSASRFPIPPAADAFSLALMGIGQGKLMVTPLHMAMVAAAVANEGLLMQPRLTFDRPIKELGRAMSAQTADQMQRMMGRVITDGTARKAFTGFQLSAGGKTGSAQNPLGDSHAWFIGFAPLENPRIAVSVVIENGGYGGPTAAPIARHAIEQAVSLGLVQR